VRTRAFLRALPPLALCCLSGVAASAVPPGEDLAAKARRGREAMAAGRFDEAAALYAEITRALPEEPGMLLNLGMALSMAGRPREAVPRLEAALRLRPDLLPASLFLGAARLELGQPARAVEPLQKVVAAQPENQEARRRLAGALWSLERYEPAGEQYRALAEQAPDDPRAWFGEGGGQAVLACAPDEVERLGGVPIRRLGVVGGDSLLRVPLDELRQAHARRSNSSNRCCASRMVSRMRSKKRALLTSSLRSRCVYRSFRC